jgi:nanoRNase/pAp phosphatase (c-di-AMP/oligoRNAs hydrolase)
MTTFVESCVETIADSAAQVARTTRGRPKAHRLLKVLAGKKRILVTTHMHPDPDALGSSLAMVRLLQARLDGAEVVLSIKGPIGGGINSAFLELSDLPLAPWSDDALASYDAIVLLDTQPSFAYSPLPATIPPTVLIDHHRARGRRPKLPFSDVRTDAGAAASIVFSYFMELDLPIAPELAASLLYAIESDLAGAAGTPGSLDNIAVSSLTLIADQRRLYRMRFPPLQRNYFVAFAEALTDATLYDTLIVAHLATIDTLEKPAVVADFLLRYDKAGWSLVTAEHDGRLILSLRTNDARLSAGEVMARVLRGIGEGGGHRRKAGGFAKPASAAAADMKRLRKQILKRIARQLKVRTTHPHKLTDPCGE